MAQNPYSSPQSPMGSGASDPAAARQQAASRISAPAVSLIVVSIVCIVFVLLGLAVDIFLLASGMVIEAADGGDPNVKIAVRMSWSVVLIIASGVVMAGALKMRKLENFGLARTAAVLAAIPCVGPCCVLGIPFGIWALMVLNDEQVRSAFRKAAP